MLLMGILFEIVVQQLAEQGIVVPADGAIDCSAEHMSGDNERKEEREAEQSASSAEG
jgi:hypothetical protein